MARRESDASFQVRDMLTDLFRNSLRKDDELSLDARDSALAFLLREGKMIGDVLAQYYEMTRQVGHTRAMFEGVGDSSIIVAANARQANDFQEVLNRKGIKARVVTIDRMDEQLRGMRGPIHIDNAAFVVLWADVRNTLKSMSERVEKMREQAAEMEDWLAVVSGQKRP